MGNVQFDEEKATSSSFTSRSIFGEQVEPTMSRLFRKWGIISKPSQAKWVMILIIVVCLGISAYLMTVTLLPAGSGTPNKTPQQTGGPAGRNIHTNS